jgi:MFS family permease
MGARLLPKTHPSEPQPFDALGTLLLFLMLSGLTVGVSQLDTKNLLGSLISPEVGPFMAVFLIMIPLVIWQERRAVDPLIRPSLFSTRQLLLVNGLAIGAGLSETALVFLPDMAVKGFNVEESVGSLLMLPVVLAMAVGSPLAGRFLDKWGSKRVIIFGTVFVTIGVALLGGLGDLLALYIVSSIIVGVGMGGLLGAPLRYIFLNEASLEDRAAAQGLLTVSTGVGQLLGSALVGAVVASQGGGIGGYKVAFVCVAVVSAVLIFMALGLKNRAEELRSLSSTQEKVAESSLTAN